MATCPIAVIFDDFNFLFALFQAIMLGQVGQQWLRHCSLIKSLSSLPKMAEKGKRKNISTYAKVLTSTPEKNYMELQAYLNILIFSDH